MKKFIMLAMVAVMLSACTEATEFGECIGINGPEDPELIYAYDAWNIAMGVIFSETFIVPIVPPLTKSRLTMLEEAAEGNVDKPKSPLKLFCISTEGKTTGNKYEILVLAETKESAIEHCIQDPAVVTQVKEQEGPFYDGYVLSTRQTHKN